MKNIAGVVITYYPKPDFITNLASYLNKVETVFIVDNSEPGFHFPEAIILNKKVTILSDGKNKGIACRLNQVAALVAEKGIQWLLTMDQDSFFEEESIDMYLHNLALFDGSEKVAMFGIEHEVNPHFYNGDFVEKTTLITSGSMLNLSLFGEIGGFNENLFIDEVDHEYCYRAIAKGFKIIKFTNIYLHHQLGENGIYHSLKSLKKTTRALHSPLRLYYMTRNFLYIQKHYQHLFKEDLKMKGRGLLHRIKNNLLYGKQRLQVMKMLAKALHDFKKGKMGKIQN